MKHFTLERDGNNRYILKNTDSSIKGLYYNLDEVKKYLVDFMALQNNPVCLHLEAHAFVDFTWKQIDDLLYAGICIASMSGESRISRGTNK